MAEATLKIFPWNHYLRLMRLHKPIGILLLLWPTLWALWLAAKGMPSWSIFIIFVMGVVLMRSAGCVVNDIFDRNFDGHVSRTRDRPLVTGSVSVKEAIGLALILAMSAFLLVLACNRLTILLSFLGALFAFIYPLLKRITHLPQLGLGIAFSWGVPMAFAAVTNHLLPSVWLLFSAALVWPVIYDTMYAMADRDDDVKIGVKSTAILFGYYDIFVLALLSVLFISLMVLVGVVYKLHASYFISVTVALALLARQFCWIRTRDPKQCFRAFLDNHWVGMILFLGIAISVSQGI